jgi:hypothetical protein
VTPEERAEGVVDALDHYLSTQRHTFAGYRLEKGAVAKSRMGLVAAVRNALAEKPQLGA